MNDSSELNYGKQMIDGYLNKVSKETSVISKELIRRSYINQDILNTTFGIYATSFCSDNDILSQWRAYGDKGNGYALGFSSSHFKLNENLQLRKIIYDENVQIKLAETTINKTLELFEEIANGESIQELDNNQTLPAFASFLHDHLSEYIFAFKHSAFAEENEVRLIFSFNKDKDLDKLRFRNFNSIPVPYIELKLGSDDKKKSLTLILEKNNYSHVEIFGSKVPLRL
jgi:hypothetical protein